MTSQIAWLIVKHIETFRVEVHDNDCHQSYRYFFFILKIYVTPIKMPNYPFGGNYSQVTNHCTKPLHHHYLKVAYWYNRICLIRHLMGLQKKWRLMQASKSFIIKTGMLH